MELHNSCKTGLIMTNLVHARQAKQQRLPARQVSVYRENHGKPCQILDRSDQTCHENPAG
jgi:hypothetical protein